MTAALTRSGVLADGTPYGILVPPDWNGRLLLDLDFLAAWQTPLYEALFARGYAAAGTIRNYDNPIGGQYIGPWADRIGQVKDRFAKEIGMPRRVIAWGVSRGGHVALALAQNQPEQIDAAIPKGIYGGAATLLNQDLDLMFSLKTLLGTQEYDLPLVNLSDGPAAPKPVGLEAGLAAWIGLLATAQSTTAGRARVALAAAIAHLPNWVDAVAPRPAEDDAEAIQYGWFLNIRERIGGSGTFSFMRPAFETSAGGNFSWNVGVDYAGLLKGRGRKTVETLYRRAGLDLETDLRTLAGAPRISADPAAVWFLKEASVHFNGAFGVPVLTSMTIGDALLPVTGLWALQEAVRRARREDMLRMTFTECVGHCTFSVAESLVLLEVMNQRLDTGEWPASTTPETLNRMANSLNADGGQFVAYPLEPSTRAFLLGDPLPPETETIIGALS